MTSLRELQAAFARSILRGEDAPLIGIVHGAGLQPEQRLQVYRNNTFISLRTALEATFPVVRRLVGDAFFAATARAFIRARPPTAPCLAEYGGAFAGFLAGYAPAAALVYLPDVARLEWALNEAQNAAAAEALDPHAVAAVPPDDYPGLRFALHPATRLVASPFPIDRIWRANQPEGDAEERIDLACGGCNLIIGRDEGGAALHAVAAAEFCFTERLAAGDTLAAAYEYAAAREPAFVPTAILHRLLSGGLLAGFGPATTD